MIVVGYHGTTSKVAEDVEKNPEKFLIRKSSRAKWLGVGVYFFQDALGHATAWARMCSLRRGGDPPIVAKAILELKDAVDLIDNRHWAALKAVISTGAPAPRQQVGPATVLSSPYAGMLDLYNNHEDDFYLTRYVDALEMRGLSVKAIRCAFIEGEPLHPRSWFFDQAHVQVCVRDPGVIQKLEWIKV